MYMYHEMPSKKIDLEFGEVEVDATAVNWIEIVNDSSTEHIYEVRRDVITNSLDHVFELCSYSWTLPPGQVYKCKIYYRPFVPCSINVDYFTIVNSAGEHTEIKVRGKCIGPVIVSSTTRLIMICTSENREAKKRIKLVNDSKVTATFMFDIDQVQRSFAIDKQCGHIRPRSRKNITITFAPRQDGIYVYRIPCLILNHKPIVIELYGYCGSVLHKTNVHSRFNYPVRLKNGFEGYVSDTIIAAQDLPAFSLSKNYIDFGQANVETENVTRTILESLCFTNHGRCDLLIIWEQDIEGIFSVTPANAKISAGQVFLFEIVFKPNRKNYLFMQELVGYVFSQEQKDDLCKETLTFPTITSVRLIGHSFLLYSDDWIPQYEICPIIRMPPCVPSCPVYTTFIIKKFGYLPLMYRFVPPISTHFIVKPMMGIIYQDYQIIIVGLLPENYDKRFYMERWTIRFNGNVKLERFIDFQGFAEYANVDFYNNRNVVKFSPIFPGCRHLQQFPMRNITRHTIKYEFVNVPPEFRILNLCNEICPNDIVTHKWEFYSTVIGNYEFDIKCILFVLKDEILVGPSICIILHVVGKCEVGLLVSVPDELNFGIQAYKTMKESSFHVFNLSPVDIHYKITCSHCNWPIGNIESDVRIHPILDTVFAGQSKIITVSITPHTPGYYELSVQYFVRISSHSNELIPYQTPRNICTIRCLCVLSGLKVKNLQCYGPCPNISKTFLWKQMKINTLNMLFKDLKPGQSQTLYANFPPMILHETLVVVKLLLANARPVTASWSVRRMQSCSCRLIKKVQGISFQRTKHDCSHRKVCSVQPKTKDLKPGEKAWITLEFRYMLLGKTETKWDLDLGHNRHIFLIITIEGLSGTENKLHLLDGTHFTFQHIYIGDKSPVYQVCWMCNSTNNSVPFYVDRGAIRNINQEYCYELFSCANPHGIVNPRSSVPLLLKFEPRQFGAFKGKLSLTLGDEEKELTLEGESSLPYKPMTVGEYVPADCNFKINDIPVHFSTDCIDVPHVATHSYVMRMIMVHNNLEHEALAYEWKRSEIPGMINVKIHPSKGLIKPRTVQSFRMIINTEGLACVINVNVPCEFINTDHRRTYQRSVYKYEDLSREMKEQFTITEKEISVPKPWINIPEKPQPFYKVITIRLSIYHPEDKFLKVNLMKELKSSPLNKICTAENEKQQIIFKKEDISRSLFILEGLLWEIVNSKLFKNMMQDISQNELNLFYPQFTMNLHERRKLIRRSNISPPRALISHILEKMLFIMIHEEFSLETVHLIQHTDIRHTSYLNIVSGMNRRRITKRETRLLHRDINQFDVKISKLPRSSRISFYEKS